MCNNNRKPKIASPSSGDGCTSELSECKKQCWQCHLMTIPIQNDDLTTKPCACGAARDPFSPGLKPQVHIFCQKCREYVLVTTDDELRYEPCHKCGFKVHAFGKGKVVDDPDDPDEGWMVVE